MGPISTGFGEIYIFTVEARRRGGKLYRRLREAIPCPPDPAHLMTYKLSLREVMIALAANNASVGAGYIECNGEQYFVRYAGQVANVEEIYDIVLSSRAGLPVRIRDVAEVREGQELRSGVATPNSEETVLGTAMLLTVSQSVAARLQEIARYLLEGVVARPCNIGRSSQASLANFGGRNQRSSFARPKTDILRAFRTKH